MALMDQRRAFQQRIQAQLFQQGVPKRSGLLTDEGRAFLAGADLSPAARRQIDVSLEVIDVMGGQAESLRDELVAFGRRQPGCKALINNRYGVGK